MAFASNVFPPYVVGGAEIMVEALATELVRRGHEVTVISLADGGAAKLTPMPGLSVHFVDAHPLGNLLLRERRSALAMATWHATSDFNPRLAGRLLPILEEARPQVLHSSNLTGLGVGVWQAAKDVGLPLLHSLQDYGLLCPRGTMFRRGSRCRSQCRLCRAATRRRLKASRLVDIVVGISRHVLAAHLSAGHFESAERAVIHTAHLPPRRIERPPPLSGPLRIGYIGRFHPTKGLELLLEAVRPLPPESYRLLLAGRGSTAYERSLRQRAEGLPASFLGWTPPERFYSEIDVLVVPSLWDEPLGMTVREAHWWGRPTVVADRGGTPEIVADGENGIVFEPLEAGALTRELGKLASEPAWLRHLSDGAWASGARPTVEDMASDYLALYDELVSTKGRRDDRLLRPPSSLRGAP